MAETATDSKKKVFINWKPLFIQHKRKTGEKQTIAELAEENGITHVTLANWETEATPAVKFLFDFMKKTGCTFEELVKECDEIPKN